MFRKQHPVFAGGGGKSGGSARTAKEASDSIRSKMFARLLDLISEGEIGGFIDNLGTPLVDAVLTSHPTIIAGVVQNNAVLGYGGKGYSTSLNGQMVYDGEIPILVVDKRTINPGKHAKAKGTIVKGVLTSVTVTNGGSGYDPDTTSLEFPSAVGKGIYIDQQVLQNPDMSYNFQNVTLDFRAGSQEQTPMHGFNVEEDTRDVSALVKNVATVSRDFFSPTADTILVNLRVDALLKQSKKTGDIKASEVAYSIYLTYLGDNYQSNEFLIRKGSIAGKTSSQYVQTESFNLKIYRREQDSNPGYRIRVTRDTIDRDTNIDPLWSYSDLFYFGFVTLQTHAPLMYPNSAYVGLQLDAQNFSSIPTRGYRLRLLKIKVPSNYFPDTRQYNRLGALASDKILAEGPTDVGNYILDEATGQPILSSTGQFVEGSAIVDINGHPVDQTWDGTFYTVWSNNPAWVFYDLATNKRYGLGVYLANGFGDIDKWQLYKIARYCDGDYDVNTNQWLGVADGYGGKEPRFSCNTYFQTSEDAHKVLTDLASVFRGMLYWGGGSIIPVQDSPVQQENILTHFTNSNVKDGMFNYSSSARNARHTVAIVQYADPKDFYKPKVEYVDHPQGLVRYGRNETRITAFGCSSRAQARRLGQWVLFTENNESEIVIFRTGFEAIYLRPFDVINVMDTNRSGIDYAGRIVSISSDRKTITTDVKSALSGEVTSMVIIFVNPAPYVPVGSETSEADLDKVRQSQLYRSSITAVSYNGDGYLTLNISEAALDNVAVGSVWGIESNTLVAKPYRITSIEEIEKHEFEITALEYKLGKYDLIEKGITFEDPNYSVLTISVTEPTNLTALVNETTDVAGRLVSKVLLSWSGPATGIAKAYVIYMKGSLGTFQLLTTTFALSFEVEIVEPDTYTFQLFSVGITGNYSPNAAEISASVGEITQAADELTSVIERISGLELFGQGNDEVFFGADARFEWRRNSAKNSYEFGSEANGANSGSMSEDFADYAIRIYDPDVLDDPTTITLENLIYAGSTTDPRFIFSYDMNLQLSQTRRSKVDGVLTYLPGVPWRKFIFEVRFRSAQNVFTAPERMLVQNPAPAKLPIDSSIQVSVIASKVWITFPQSGNTDFNGYRIWFSSINGFVPSDHVTDTPPYHIAPVYEGRANPVNLPGVTVVPGTYYLRYAEIDVFSKQVLDCNISDQRTLSVS